MENVNIPFVSLKGLSFNFKRLVRRTQLREFDNYYCYCHYIAFIINDYAFSQVICNIKKQSKIT